MAGLLCVGTGVFVMMVFFYIYGKYVDDWTVGDWALIAFAMACLAVIFYSLPLPFAFSD